MARRTERRGFLHGAAAGLGASWARPVLSWAAESRSPSGRDRWVSIPTREHFGDVEERLQIPPAWDFKAYEMAGAGAPTLGPAQIRARVEAPIGSKRLADLARGKRSAVITFDDMTRATPAAAIVPHVIAELKAAGIPDDRILFLASYGSHPPMDQQAVARKLGAEWVDRYPWVNHNAWENLVDIGTTTRKNRVKVNQHFRQAGVRITISGVKSHIIAGYGGGAKAVLPGIANVDAIDYVHRTIARNNTTCVPLKVFTNECRKDMIEAARLAHVDFSVQVVVNGRRQVIGVFAGDVVEAHVAACRAANKLHRTEAASNADVVVVNAYPQNLQAQLHLSWARACLRDGGTAVLILQHPLGFESWHYAHERWDHDDRAFHETRDLPGWTVSQAGRLVVYSADMQARSRVKFARGTVFARTWADTVAAVAQSHKGTPRVALYPYAGIQHPPRDLDG